MKKQGTKADMEAMAISEDHQRRDDAKEVNRRQHYDLERRSEIREGAQKLRKQYLRYREAEIIYSMSHKKLLELAGEAGALVRIDSTVLINRDRFDEYLEQFREESTLTSGRRYAR